MARVDLSGRRFGRLTAIRATDERTHDGGVLWLCRCDCGNVCKVKTAYLISGHTSSCGCLSREKASANGKIPHYKHNGSRTRLYGVWRNMLQRCYSPNKDNYPNYGGRGITVCDEWKKDFGAFQKWALANGYDKDAPRGACTLDRIDNNKGYSPQNCRFVSMHIQAVNKRNLPKRQGPKPLYEIDGEVKTSKEWSIVAGISQKCFLDRWEKGERGANLIRPRYKVIHPAKRK